MDGVRKEQIWHIMIPNCAWATGHCPCLSFYKQNIQLKRLFLLDLLRRAGETSLLFCLCPLFCAAQKADPVLALLDVRLDHWAKQDNRDSVAHYLTLKITRSRQLDSLALWAWAWYDFSEYFADNQDFVLGSVSKAMSQKWREPRHATEAEPFMYLWINLALLQTQNGSIWQSVQAYEQAARLFEAYHYPDFDAVESLYKPLGNHFTRLGDNEKAIAIFHKALPLCQSPESKAGVLNNLGIALWNQGNYNVSEQLLRTGLHLPRISELKRAMLSTAMARNLTDQGRYHEALLLAQKALVLSLKKQHAGPEWLKCRAYARRAAGMAYSRIGRLPQAAEALQKALEDTRQAFGPRSREWAKAQLAWADFLLIEGKPEPALSATNDALRALIPSFLPKGPNENPAGKDLYEENTLYEALQLKANAAEQLYEQTNDHQWLIHAMDCHDLAWQAEMRLRQVYRYQSAKLGLQKMARERERSAIRMAHILFERTHDDAWFFKGLSISERNRATLLAEALEENLVRQKLANQDNRFAELATLRQSRAYFERQLLTEPDHAQAVQWRSELDQIVSSISALELALKGAFPNLDQYVSNNSFSDIYHSLKTLDDHEILLEFFVAGKDVYLFVCQNNMRPQWRVLPFDTGLKDLLQQFSSCFKRADIILNDPEKYLATAWELSQKMGLDQLNAGNRLLIVPDGPFHFVPFEALVVQAPDAHTSLRNAVYLLRQQRVRYAWSISTLIRQEAMASKAKQPFLGFSPMQSTGLRGLAPLPEASKEWASVKNKTLRLDEEATWKNFAAMAPDFDILHLCTHAFGTGEAPHIEMYDQAVYLPDIYALPLQAHLVVLSACETGLGSEQSGEGVMSLARAFGQAGSACLISSLWMANDVSTALIFNQFYQNIQKGHSTASALRDAKLSYLNDPQTSVTLQSPYFWAGFSMVGADQVWADRAVRWPWFLGLFLLLLLSGYTFLKRKKRLP